MTELTERQKSILRNAVEVATDEGQWGLLDGPHGDRVSATADELNAICDVLGIPTDSWIRR